MTPTISDETAGDMINRVHAARPDWVPIGGGMKARYVSTFEVDENGDWKVIGDD